MEMKSENSHKNYNIKNSFNKVTFLSKYLAITLFVVLPFVGGWIGYQYGYSNPTLKEIKVIESLPQNQQKSINSAPTLQNIEGNFFTLHNKAVYVSSSVSRGFVEIEGIDANSATVIEDYYVIKDNTTVYSRCSGKFKPLMPDYISVSSFDIVEWPYFKDNYHVYYFNTYSDKESPNECYVTMLEGADPKTFEVFDGRQDKICDWYNARDLDPYRPIYYVKDSMHVYCADKIVENADPSRCTYEDTSNCKYQPSPMEMI